MVASQLPGPPPPLFFRPCPLPALCLCSLFSLSLHPNYPLRYLFSIRPSVRPVHSPVCLLSLLPSSFFISFLFLFLSPLLSSLLPSLCLSTPHNIYTLPSLPFFTFSLSFLTASLTSLIFHHRCSISALLLINFISFHAIIHSALHHHHQRTFLISSLLPLSQY